MGQRNELRDCLQYFSATGVWDRGPNELVGAGPREVRGLTWSEWFAKRWGESFDSYVARAKRDGLGDRAREYAEWLRKQR